ncbi:MAG: hypothetical protein IPJ32_08320 [Sphingobacteriaceae bacterium]|nr:hypothetical protein [Sphingobacteriaceae bacterium]
MEVLTETVFIEGKTGFEKLEVFPALLMLMLDKPEALSVMAVLLVVFTDLIFVNCAFMSTPNSFTI